MTNSLPETALATVAEPFLDTAISALQELLPASFIDVVGPETVLVTQVPDFSAFSKLCSSQVPYVRHLARPVIAVASSDETELANALAECIDPKVERYSLQAWKASEHVAEKAEHVRAETFKLLIEKFPETRFVRSKAEQTLGVCLAEDSTYICVTPSVEALSDWPAGRIRLAKRKEQISRSEFKLEELANCYPAVFTSASEQSTAVDLGASPGGWTRILRSKGFAVNAVDPGLLDPQIEADRHVAYYRMTAEDFFAMKATQAQKETSPFDLIVNDMRMDPQDSVQLVVEAADFLKPAGYVILTLKIGEAGLSLADSLEQLQTKFNVVFHRQLFHNRSETTVVAQRR